MSEIHEDIAPFVESIVNGQSDCRMTYARQFSDWWQSNRGEQSPLGATSKDIVDFLNWQSERGLAPHSLRTARQTVAVTFEAAMDLGHVEDRENPAKDIEFSRYVDGYSSNTKKQGFADNDEGIVYLTRKETRKLRESVPDPKLRNELLIKMMVQTGARRNEISSLKLDDVHREQGAVTLRDDKKDKVRTVPYNDLSPELGMWVEKYRAANKPASRSDYLFLTQQSEQLSVNRISDIIRIAADEAGIQEVMYHDANGDPRRKVTPHALRHTYAVRMLETDEVNLRYLQKLMGHKDISQTETYLKITDDDAAEAYNEADPTFEA